MSDEPNLSKAQEQARALAERHGDGFLDKVVHDLYAGMAEQLLDGGADPEDVFSNYEEAASRLNNEGPAAQAEFLVRELGARDAMAVITKAASKAEA